MKNFVRMFLAILFPVTISGCVNESQRYFNETSSVDTTSAYQLIDRSKLEDIDLVALLDPDRTGIKPIAAAPDALQNIASKSIDEKTKAEAEVANKKKAIAGTLSIVETANDRASKLTETLGVVTATEATLHSKCEVLVGEQEKRQSELNQANAEFASAKPDQKQAAQDKVKAAQHAVDQANATVVSALEEYRNKQNEVKDIFKQIGENNKQQEVARGDLNKAQNELTVSLEIARQKTEAAKDAIGKLADATLSSSDPDIVLYRNHGQFNNGHDIDIAIRSFHERYSSQPTIEAKRRDEIQERILGASTQRCNAFKGKLHRDFSRTNFWLGTGATATAAAGAIAGTATAAKTLSAFSGLFSGARAEYDQDFFGNLMVNVIVDGIEAKQNEIKSSIIAVRRKYGVDQYPVEAAIADALYFHGQCSIVTGLQYASASIKTSTDPGVDAAARVMLKFRQLKTIADPNTTPEQLNTEVTATDSLLANKGLSGNNLVSQALPSINSYDSASLQADIIISQFQSLMTDKGKIVGNVPPISDSQGKQLKLTDAIGGISTAAQSSFDACLAAAKKNDDDYYLKTAKLKTSTDETQRNLLETQLSDLKSQASQIKAGLTTIFDFIKSEIDKSLSNIQANPDKATSNDITQANTNLKNISSSIPQPKSCNL